MTLRARLQDFCACGPALEWAGDRELRSAWAECERGDWMLWLAVRIGVDRRQIVRAACACARLALPYVAAGETGPLRAIETAESWCRGEATIKDVRGAVRAANGDPAAFAAYAAAYAAVFVVGAATNAAANAAAASATSGASARAECADLVRGIIMADDIERAIEGGES